MSINAYILGPPNSGKTTTAAKVFAKLKETGLAVEFIPERARYHIAEKRFRLGLRPDETPLLTDDDQIQIFQAQAAAEQQLDLVCSKDTIVIADSWSAASLLYMSEMVQIVSPACIESISRVQGVICTSNPLVFSLASVPFGDAEDANRVHNAFQSQELGKKIPEMLSRWFPNVFPIPVSGNPDERAEAITKHIRRRVAEGG